jgi:hypothetical protein
MRIVRLTTIIALLSTALSAQAAVKKEENTKVQFAGMLGKMMGMFGGKAADEGLRSVVVVKGDRKLTRTGDTGDLVDLAEEKIYQINFKDKNYKVLTFEQMRQQMREAQEKMAKEMEKMKGQEPPTSPQQPNNIEFEYDLKESGQKKTIAGFATREMVMTITMHEKGKKIEDAGGMALVSNIWLTPKLPGNDEIIEFDLKFYQKLASAIDMRQAQQMAAVMASNPMMGDMTKKFAEESKNLDGTAVLTVTTIEGVQSKEQMAQAAQSGQEQKNQDSKADIPIGGDKKSIAGGIFGGIARKAVQKKVEERAAENTASSTPGRSTIMTSTSELLSVSSSVADADVTLPTGLIEKK